MNGKAQILADGMAVALLGMNNPIDFLLKYSLWWSQTGGNDAFGC